MARYLIKWDCGWGQCCDECEAESQEDADKEAYQQWLNEAAMEAEYSAVPMTKELAEDYGFDWEGDQ